MYSNDEWNMFVYLFDFLLMIVLDLMWLVYEMIGLWCDLLLFDNMEIVVWYCFSCYLLFEDVLCE